MPGSLKNTLRRKIRAMQRGRQYPILLPHHRVEGGHVHSVNGVDRSVAPELARALLLCDGTHTLAGVASEARIARSRLIEAHDDGLILIWREPIPRQAPALDHSPHAIVLSPHPDDAALSCGGRMLGDHAVLVINIFSRAAWWRFDLGSSEQIQSVRDGEEELVSRLSGCPISALGLPEALLRGHKMDSVFTAAPDARDDDVAAQLRDAFASLAHAHTLAHWFIPLAIGGHIDHRIVRETAWSILPAAGVKKTHLHFYEDLPYAAKGQSHDFFTTHAQQAFTRESLDVEDALFWKLELLRAYWSQFTWPQIAELGVHSRRAGAGEPAEITWTPHDGPIPI
jgi:LmbE family N-acetylglucosaminyl deacetylase